MHRQTTVKMSSSLFVFLVSDDRSEMDEVSNVSHFVKTIATLVPHCQKMNTFAAAKSR